MHFSCSYHYSLVLHNLFMHIYDIFLTLFYSCFKLQNIVHYVHLMTNVKVIVIFFLFLQYAIKVIVNARFGEE